MITGLKKDVSDLIIPQIGEITPRKEYEMAENGKMHISVSARLAGPVPVGEWHCTVKPAFRPDFFYSPLLTPTDEHVVDMHVFRTPVLMMGDRKRVLCVLPDTDGWTDERNRLVMDLDAGRLEMKVGINTTKIKEHSLYVGTNEAVLPAGEFRFGFTLWVLTGKDVQNPFRPVLAAYWERYGHVQRTRLPVGKDLIPYVRHTYAWAFDRWQEAVWQEFDLNGVRVGAPQMIVKVHQSPHYVKENGPTSLLEATAVWNQAWFSSLRSALGVYRWGKKTGDAELIRRAEMTKELALQMPQEDGLFDAVVAVPTETVTENGQTYTRAGSWDRLYFGNSNRNPVTRDLKESPRHILDMSWTALQMLDWYEYAEKDERLMDYVGRFVRRLMRLQDARGYFPGWLDRNCQPLPQLLQSPESAVSATLLMRYGQLTGQKECVDSALRCADVLLREVVPESRWEDFETYWSCSRFGEEHLGRKFERNGMYKQCSLSPFYLAQMYLKCYQITGKQEYLATGERCLDEMLMYQSSFQPDYMPITTVGGFGVMNGDCELNDQRQALFAPLIVEYGRFMRRDEYVERGYAALEASFSMMYCPENPEVRSQWEQKWPFLNESDFGFMMENYGHGGYANGKSVGIGIFTIYDWGNGGASASVMEMLEREPEMFE